MNLKLPHYQLPIPHPHPHPHYQLPITNLFFRFQC